MGGSGRRRRRGPAPNGETQMTTRLFLPFMAMIGAAFAPVAMADNDGGRRDDGRRVEVSSAAVARAQAREQALRTRGLVVVTPEVRVVTPQFRPLNPVVDPVVSGRVTDRQQARAARRFERLDDRFDRLQTRINDLRDD